MNEADKQLVNLLQNNARESISELARKLNLSRSTVQDRIDRLEKKGIIKGYTIRFTPEYEQHQISAHVLINVNPKMHDQVVRQLKQTAILQSLYAVSGPHDLIAILKSETTQDMDSSLDEIGQIDGIDKTISSIVLSTKLER
jgi:DNA-binding Lrp family transcriptional regulator